MERYTQWSGKNTCPWHRHSDGTPASFGITLIISKMKTNSNLAFSFNWVQKSDTLEGRSSRTFSFSFFLQFTIVCRKHPLVRRCCGYTAIRKLLTLVEKGHAFCNVGREGRQGGGLLVCIFFCLWLHVSRARGPTGAIRQSVHKLRGSSHKEHVRGLSHVRYDSKLRTTLDWRQSAGWATVRWVIIEWVICLPFLRNVVTWLIQRK